MLFESKSRIIQTHIKSICQIVSYSSRESTKLKYRKRQPLNLQQHYHHNSLTFPLSGSEKLGGLSSLLAVSNNNYNSFVLGIGNASLINIVELHTSTSRTFFNRKMGDTVSSASG